MSPFAPSLSLAAVAVLLFAIFGQAAQVNATRLDSLKRAREATSSLIPFPRVGRSGPGTAADPRLYFGQKRTGKSSLIPFPRVGKRSMFLRNHFRDDAPVAAEAADLDRYLESTHQPRGRDEYGEYDPMALVVPALKNLIRRIEENERMK